MTNIFSHSLDCLFILLMVRFDAETFFILIKFSFSIFSFVACALMPCLRNLCKIQCPKWTKGPISVFCIWRSSFPSTPYWRDWLFFIEWSWHLCQNHLIIHVKVCFWDHCSIPLVYLLLMPYVYYCSFVGKLWNEEVWVFLFLSFSNLFWLFGVPWDSTWILKWVFLLLQKMSMGFW